MSDSDFERFLQESLSSSTASYHLHAPLGTELSLRRSLVRGGGAGLASGTLQRQSLEEEETANSSSDLEHSAAALSWLKTTSTLRDPPPALGDPPWPGRQRTSAGEVREETSDEDNDGSLSSSQPGPSCSRSKSSSSSDQFTRDSLEGSDVKDHSVPHTTPPSPYIPHGTWSVGKSTHVSGVEKASSVTECVPEEDREVTPKYSDEEFEASSSSTSESTCTLVSLHSSAGGFPPPAGVGGGRGVQAPASIISSSHGHHEQKLLERRPGIRREEEEEEEEEEDTAVEPSNSSTKVSEFEGLRESSAHKMDVAMGAEKESATMPSREHNKPLVLAPIHHPTELVASSGGGSSKHPMKLKSSFAHQIYSEKKEELTLSPLHSTSVVSSESFVERKQSSQKLTSSTPLTLSPLNVTSKAHSSASTGAVAAAMGAPVSDNKTQISTVHPLENTSMRVVDQSSQESKLLESTCSQVLDQQTVVYPDEASSVAVTSPVKVSTKQQQPSPSSKHSSPSLQQTERAHVTPELRVGARVHVDDAGPAHSVSLEGDMLELQNALEAAGLPGIGRDDGGGGGGGVGTSMDGLTAAREEFETRVGDMDRAEEAVRVGSSDVEGGEASDGREMEMENLIRAIAADELVSMTVGMLQRPASSEEGYPPQKTGGPDIDNNLQSLVREEVKREVREEVKREAEGVRVGTGDGRKGKQNKTRERSQAAHSKLQQVHKAPPAYKKPVLPTEKRRTAQLRAQKDRAPYNSREQKGLIRETGGKGIGAKATEGIRRKTGPSEVRMVGRALTTGDPKRKGKTGNTMDDIKHVQGEKVMQKTQAATGVVPPSSAHGRDYSTPTPPGDALHSSDSELYQKLQKEIEEQKVKCGKLSMQVEEYERESMQREKLMAEISVDKESLKQEVELLTFQLDESRGPRAVMSRTAGKGKEESVVSEEQRKELVRKLDEQEVLMKGYQKENERLYQEVNSLRKEMKVKRDEHSREIQHLTLEHNTTKSLLHKAAMQKSPQRNESPVAKVSVAHSSHLEEALEKSQEQCKQLEAQVKQLTQAAQCVEGEHRQGQLKAEQVLEGERQKWRAERKELREELDRCTEKHKKETSTLQSKEEELAMLKKKMERLKAIKNSGAKRVRELELKVKQLESVIQKRFPNSISALILATSSSSSSKNPDEKEEEEEAGSVKDLAHLRRRVRELEVEQGERGKEEQRRMQALQQQYSAMESRYENQLKSLKDQLSTLGPGKPSPTGPTTAGQHPTHKETDLVGDGEATVRLRLLQTEKSNLKDTICQLKLEVEHQKVFLRGKCAEMEGRERQSREEAEEKIAAMRRDHQSALDQLQRNHAAKVDQLVTTFAQQQRQSQHPELKGKISALETTITLLRKELEVEQVNRDVLARSRHREAELEKQVGILSQQIVDAKKYHTPQMHHFNALQARIDELDHRVSRYVKVKEDYSDLLHHSSSKQELKELQSQWERCLVSKNMELQHFREELDSLLHGLYLMQHGTKAL